MYVQYQQTNDKPRHTDRWYARLNKGPKQRSRAMPKGTAQDAFAGTAQQNQGSTMKRPGNPSKPTGKKRRRISTSMLLTTYDRVTAIWKNYIQFKIEQSKQPLKPHKLIVSPIWEPYPIEIVGSSGQVYSILKVLESIAENFINNENTQTLTETSVNKSNLGFGSKCNLTSKEAYGVSESEDLEGEDDLEEEEMEEEEEEN